MHIAFNDLKRSVGLETCVSNCEVKATKWGVEFIPENGGGAGVRLKKG